MKCVGEAATCAGLEMSEWRRTLDHQALQLRDTVESDAACDEERPERRNDLKSQTNRNVSGKSKRWE